MSKGTNLPGCIRIHTYLYVAREILMGGDINKEHDVELEAQLQVPKNEYK